ncbi:tetratricopeptide repeat protein [Nanoarchaeota archaeon]
MKLPLRTFHLIAIILLTSLVYSNIFQNDFVWDDFDFIVNWEETRSLKNMPLFLKGAVPTNHEGVYRPLRGVFYALSYQLWGLNQVGYHLQSILIHLTCTLLVYLITLQITKKNIIAFMCSLVFGVHPIHIEAVTFMTSTFDTIGIIFFLASFYLYIKSDFAKNKSIQFASLLFALLAFFTYELTLTLPLLLVLYDFCFKRINKKNAIERIKLYIPYFIAIIIYFSIRVSIVHTSMRGDYLAGSFYITMLLMTKAFLKYISLVAFPVGLSVDHTISKGISSFRIYAPTEVLLSQSIFNPDILFSIAVLICLLVVAVKSFKKYPIISFCIGWFFIALGPVSNIIPQYMLLAEKYLYIPSFGFCLLFSSIIYYIYNIRMDNKKMMKYVRIASVVLFAFTVLSYSALTVSRNNDWENEFVLWSRAVETSPESISSHNNLGLIYHDNGKINLAIEEYMKIIELNPGSFEAFYNLADAYYSQDKIDLAIEQYKNALEINPKYAPAHYNLGNAYRKQEKLSFAMAEYRRAIQLEPSHANAHNNLGITYYLLDEVDLAIEHFKKALAIEPEHKSAYNNLNKALGDS